MKKIIITLCVLLLPIIILIIIALSSTDETEILNADNIAEYVETTNDECCTEEAKAEIRVLNTLPALFSTTFNELDQFIMPNIEELISHLTFGGTRKPEDIQMHEISMRRTIEVLVLRHVAQRPIEDYLEDFIVFMEGLTKAFEDEFLYLPNNFEDFEIETFIEDTLYAIENLFHMNDQIFRALLSRELPRFFEWEIDYFEILNAASHRPHIDFRTIMASLPNLGWIIVLN